MIDQKKASTLAGEAFDRWQAGDLEQSKRLYEEAIPLAEPTHYGLSSYHGEFACVLNELGDHEQATKQLEQALATDLEQGNAEGSSALIIARYFLSNQLLIHGSAAQALEVLLPSVTHAPNDWLTRVIEAHVLFALDRKIEAKASAALAIENAPSPQKAEELKQNLAIVLS